MYEKGVKPCIDKFLAFMLLILLFPVMMTVALWIYLTIGKPILFRQKRPGHKGHIFQIYKFRTMSNDVDKNGHSLPDSIRLTKLGKFIRSTSLDELPQLFNVLKSDMSFVGPRPLLTEYLPLYNIQQAMRHDVKPGITGWAQVNGRNAISWEEKFEYDVWYVKNQSFLLDMKIVWLTFLKVLKRSDVNSKTSVSMEKFEGSK